MKLAAFVESIFELIFELIFVLTVELNVELTVEFKSDVNPKIEFHTRLVCFSGGTVIAKSIDMTKPKYKQFKANIDRECLNRAVDVADKMQEYEKILIEMLFEIDRNRYYVRYGFNSLLGFCNRALNLSRTQSQRIVTNVRLHVGAPQRTEPTVNFGNEKVGGPVDKTENRSDH